MKQAYVTALTNSILSGQPVAEALDNLKAILVRKGHLRLWPQILRATKRVLEARLRSHIPQVAVVKNGSVSELEIKTALAALGVAETTAYTTVEDTTLAGGFTARFKGLMVDQSYKRALVDLYRNVIKS